ncbi:MAG TPA: hypothetical protein HA362_06910 [Nanoarchaeota archaeon]|nr:hypothetical protein [Nanoarchaeota archaeon]
MTLEEDIIRLRPHHVLRYFRDWAFAAEDAIIKAHDVGYGRKYFDKLFTVKRQLLAENHPFIIVPAADDLCITCGRRPNRPQCEVPDAEYFILKAKGIGVKLEGINTPLGIVDRILHLKDCGMFGSAPEYERLYEQLRRRT